MKGQARRAAQADHEGIKSIIPVGEFVGDYLPDCLPCLRENTLYTDFVYTIGDEIIGYFGAWLIDGGSTACFTNGRVKKEYQGKGILGIMGQETLHYLPRIRYSTYATFTNLDQVYRQISRNISRIISVRKCLFYSGCKEDIIFTGLQTVRETANTKILSKETLSGMFAEKLSYPHVFHDDRLLVFGIPYSVMESNVSIILMGKTRAIVSFRENKTRTLLSFGTHFRQPNGDMFCTIDIYGPVAETFTDHIMLHIQSFQHLIGDSFTIELRLNEYSYVIEETMKEIGLVNTSSGFSRRTECVVTEQCYNSASKL